MSELLPQLDGATALELVDAARAKSLEEVAAELPALDVRVTVPPIGGKSVGEDQLYELRAGCLTIARDFGFPSRKPSDLPAMEAAFSELIYDALRLSPYSASDDSGWSYLTCCWLLDIAIWRWGESADSKRFVGDLNRNTFRRLWWRRFTLGDEIDLSRLQEDELVALFERPTIAGDARIAKQIVQRFIAFSSERSDVPSTALMRDVMKRILRLTPFIELASLDDATLEGVIDSQLVDSGMALGVAGLAQVAWGESVVAREADFSNVTRASSASVSQSDESLAELAVRVARSVGRVTNITLREAADIDRDRAREVLAALVDSGELSRRGARRGTYYVASDGDDSTAIESHNSDEETSSDSAAQSAFRSRGFESLDLGGLPLMIAESLRAYGPAPATELVSIFERECGVVGTAEHRELFKRFVNSGKARGYLTAEDDVYEAGDPQPDGLREFRGRSLADLAREAAELGAGRKSASPSDIGKRMAQKINGGGEKVPKILEKSCIYAAKLERQRSS